MGRWCRHTQIGLQHGQQLAPQILDQLSIYRTLFQEACKFEWTHVRTVAEAAVLEVPGAVVACVPDLPPRTEAEKTVRAVVREFLERKGGERGAMLEMCYNPTPWTELGAIAEEAGWQVILGTEALIWQVIEQVPAHEMGSPSMGHFADYS